MGQAFPEPSRDIESMHAVDFLIEDVDRQLPDRSITVCLIGPMTNMGMALVKEPAIAGKGA